MITGARSDKTASAGRDEYSMMRRAYCELGDLAAQAVGILSYTMLIFQNRGVNLTNKQIGLRKLLKCLQFRQISIVWLLLKPAAAIRIRLLHEGSIS